jgi:hypothetical protein
MQDWSRRADVDSAATPFVTLEGPGTDPKERQQEVARDPDSGEQRRSGQPKARASSASAPYQASMMATTPAQSRAPSVAS